MVEDKSKSSKKGLIIGISTGVGIAAITGVIILVIALPRFTPKTDGFVIPENNYSKYISSCSIDATMDKSMSEGNPMKAKEIKPYKTEYYTEDGYPIWGVGATWQGYDGGKGASYTCYLGTNADGAYLIELKINGKTAKTYKSDAKIVDKDGAAASLTK